MRFAVALLIALAACAEFPALDDTVPPAQARSDFPDLVPLAPLIAQAGAATSTAATAASDLSPRLAGLNARAARLRGPVIPAPVRTRMLRGIR
jgi:hypothetical protein